MRDTIIAARGLSKSYRRGSENVHALRATDLSVGKGEFVSIVGPSGSGKSTLLHLLGLLETPSSGRISLQGRETSWLKERDLVKVRRGSIGFVFQQFLLLPTLTVEENIELPLLFSRKSVNKDRIAGIMEMLELTHRARHLPHQLSGGEMQRVSIGRALVNEPGIIMADEPTGNLDTATADKIYSLFKRLNEGGLSLIVVTHNMELAGRADRVIRLRDGQIISD
ncbi:MAG: ABC transporter ATP-binding protein [Dehalococcoidia bacterium]|nr:ABC transporter ATP-binding protein [Dehalococcoidia bacterium]